MDFAEDDYTQDLQRSPPSPQRPWNIQPAGGARASQGYDRANSRVLQILPATYSAQDFCLRIPVKRNHFNRLRGRDAAASGKNPRLADALFPKLISNRNPQPSVPVLESVAANPPLPSRIQTIGTE